MYYDSLAQFCKSDSIDVSGTCFEKLRGIHENIRRISFGESTNFAYQSFEELVEILLATTEDLSLHHRELIELEARKSNSFLKTKNDDLLKQIESLQAEITSARTEVGFFQVDHQINQVLPICLRCINL